MRAFNSINSPIQVIDLTRYFVGIPQGQSPLIGILPAHEDRLPHSRPFRSARRHDLLHLHESGLQENPGQAGERYCRG